MIIGIGTDIVEITRIEHAIERNGNHFLSYVFTENEINYCSKKRGYQSYAVRFAAKEAFAKAIGTGIGKELSFKEIEIYNDERGKPYIKYTGNFLDNYRNLKIHLSLSHSKDNGIAFVTIEGILND